MLPNYSQEGPKGLRLEKDSHSINVCDTQVLPEPLNEVGGERHCILATMNSTCTLQVTNMKK
jgi:hypothetical protein